MSSRLGGGDLLQLEETDGDSKALDASGVAPAGVPLSSIRFKRKMTKQMSRGSHTFESAWDCDDGLMVSVAAKGNTGSIARAQFLAGVANSRQRRVLPSFSPLRPSSPPCSPFRADASVPVTFPPPPLVALFLPSSRSHGLGFRTSTITSLSSSLSGSAPRRALPQSALHQSRPGKRVGRASCQLSPQPRGRRDRRAWGRRLKDPSCLSPCWST
jgi:hypothetical protein